MQIEDKYQFLEAVAGLGGTEDVAVPAWEKSTGRLVFVHILAGGRNAETKAVLNAIGSLPPQHSHHVLGAGDYSGSAYVVTEALPWGASLRNWVDTVSRKAAPMERPAEPFNLLQAGVLKIPVVKPRSSAQASEPPPPSSRATPLNAEPAATATPAEAGEFAAPLWAATSETPAYQSAAPVAPPSTSGPGEFTRLMQAVKPLPPPVPTARPALQDVPPLAAPPPPSGPGEFTRLMQRPVPPPSPAEPPPQPAARGEFTHVTHGERPVSPPPLAVPPPPSPKAAGPSEFTRLMQAPPPVPPAPGEQPWRYDNAVPSPEVTPPSAGGPGEFTRMFKVPPAPAAPPVASFPGNGGGGSGEFTRMMRAPSAPEENLFTQPSTNESDLFAPPSGSATPADDFSRMSGGTQAAPSSSSPPQPAPAPATAAYSKSSILPLVLILGGLLIVAIILVVIFTR